MTIKYNGKAVLTKQKVRTKDALVVFFSGEPGKPTSFELLPDLDFSEDTVRINRNHAPPVTLKGRGINFNPACREYGIEWSAFSSKER